MLFLFYSLWEGEKKRTCRTFLLTISPLSLSPSLSLYLSFLFFRVSIVTQTPLIFFSIKSKTEYTKHEYLFLSFLIEINTKRKWTWVLLLSRVFFLHDATRAPTVKKSFLFLFRFSPPPPSRMNDNSLFTVKGGEDRIHARRPSDCYPTETRRLFEFRSSLILYNNTILFSSLLRIVHRWNQWKIFSFVFLLLLLPPASSSSSSLSFYHVLKLFFE